MLLDTVVVVIITGALTFGGTYLSAILKYRKVLEAKYDISLRNIRIDHYKELYKRLSPLASYPQPNQFTSNGLALLSTSINDWYHKEGGLFLSHSGRDAYDAFQKEIQSSNGLALLSTSISDWYHKEGGLFLSHSGRDAYDAFQKEIQREIKLVNDAKDKDKVEDPKTYANGVRDAGHELRKTLAEDVGTRQVTPVTDH
jgi:hypothetical protein